MAKIILLYVVTLLMIFSLFWNHGNATTPRKLGIRKNAITSLPYKVTSRGSLGRYSIASSPLVHANVETLRLLGNRYNGVTSLPSTKEATFDRPGRHYFTISSSSADHANVATPSIIRAQNNGVMGKATFGGLEGQDTLIPSSLAYTNVIIPRGPNIVTSLPNTNEATNSAGSAFHSYPISSSSPTQMDVAHYFNLFSSSQMWQPKKSKATPPKLWASHHNGVTSLSDTNKASTSRASRIQHSPISSLSTPTHATIRHTLQTHYGVVTSLSNTNKAITSHASRHAATRGILQTRVGGIQKSLSDTNKAMTSRGSAIHYYPISSSSSTYAHATIPHTLGARHNTITSSPNADEGTTRKHGVHQNPIIITSLPSTN